MKKLTKKQKQTIVDFYFSSPDSKSILECDNEMSDAWDKDENFRDKIDDFLQECYEIIKENFK